MLPVNSLALKDNSQGGVEEDERAKGAFSPAEFAVRGELYKGTHCA